MTDRQFYVAIYDVGDDRRRARLARLLLRYGDRVQKSAFQLWVDTSQLELIIRTCREFLDSSEDVLHLYPLCKRCRESAVFLGRGQILPRRQDVVV